MNGLINAMCRIRQLFEVHVDKGFEKSKKIRVVACEIFRERGSNTLICPLGAILEEVLYFLSIVELT